MTWLDLIPKWVWAALVAALAATSCKLKLENGVLSLEIEKHATHIASLQANIATARADAAETSARLVEQARKAEQARDTRIKALLADSARLESELDRMQLALSKEGPWGLRAPASAIAPGLDYVDPLPELLVSCSRRYSELAGKADGHANDVQTLIDAWPKEKPDAPTN